MAGNGTSREVTVINETMSVYLHTGNSIIKGMKQLLKVC